MGRWRITMEWDGLRKHTYKVSIVEVKVHAVCGTYVTDGGFDSGESIGTFPFKDMLKMEKIS